MRNKLPTIKDIRPMPKCKPAKDDRKKFLEQDEFILFLKYCQQMSPYPEDIFTPPTAEEKKLATKVLLENGIIPDRIFADFGRKVWNNCINDLIDTLEDN